MREKGKGLGVLGALFVVAAMASAHSPTKKTFEERVSKKVIPHSVSYEISRTVAPGRTVKKKEGKDGALITTYRVTLINGKPVAKHAISTARVQPVNALVLMGKPNFNVSRSSFNRKKSMSTGYDTSPQTLPGSSGRTATGMKAQFGVVAVDPRIIPLGTYVFVEGYGFAIAADTGGAIKGKKIDLCFNSRRESLAWGRRPVKVHILGK
jgi:3D (Asp-Asp-Asp) domain-containing protein